MRIAGADRFASASKAARRAVSGSAPPSIWPSIQDWSSPAMRAMERISAFASARVSVFGAVGRGRGGGRVGHLCLHANVGAGVGGRRHQGNLVGRPAHGGQHARAVLGGLGPVLDRVADRDVAQDARQHVLPDRLHLGPGRELDERPCRACRRRRRCGRSPARRARRSGDARRGRWRLRGATGPRPRARGSAARCIDPPCRGGARARRWTRPPRRCGPPDRRWRAPASRGG